MGITANDVLRQAVENDGLEDGTAGEGATPGGDPTAPAGDGTAPA